MHTLATLEGVSNGNRRAGLRAEKPRPFTSAVNTRKAKKLERVYRQLTPTLYVIIEITISLYRNFNKK